MRSLGEAGLNAPENNRRGLIIQPGAIGDGILTLPLVRMLRAELRIDLVDIMGHTDYLSILPGRGDVASVISLEQTPLHSLFTDSGSYDPADDDPLLGLFRPYEAVVTFLADEAGHFERNLVHVIYITHAADVATVQLRPPADYPSHVGHFFMEQFAEQLAPHQLAIRQEFTTGPLLQICPADRQLGQEVFAKYRLDRQDRIITLHPGSGSNRECWPLSRFRHLASLLAQEGFQPVMLIGPAEQRIGNDALTRLASEMPLLEQLSLEEVLAVLSCSAGYIGCDSGISHLAGALGVRTVAIFGPTCADQWRPLGPNGVACRTGTPTAKTWPTVEQVMAALDALQ